MQELVEQFQIETDEGYHVNLLDDGSFQIIPLGVIAHRLQ